MSGQAGKLRGMWETFKYSSCMLLTMCLQPLICTINTFQTTCQRWMNAVDHMCSSCFLWQAVEKCNCVVCLWGCLNDVNGCSLSNNGSDLLRTIGGHEKQDPLTMALHYLCDSKEWFHRETTKLLFSTHNTSNMNTRVSWYLKLELVKS